MIKRFKQCVIGGVIVIPLILLCIHLFHYPIFSPRDPVMQNFSELEQTLCCLRIPSIEVPAEWRNRCPRRGIVSVSQGGRLGNQMWEYVSVYAVARETGLEPFVPRCILETLEEHFEKMNIPPMSYISECEIDRDQIVGSIQDWRYAEQSIMLRQYILTWSLASKWFDDIRHEFVFKAELRDSARAILASLSERFNMSKPTFVGVHVRRTDYMEHLRTIYKLTPAPVSFYHNAMDYFEKKYKNVIFVVASDSPEWCRENLHRKKSRIDVISEPNEKGPGRDMAVMASCNHSLFDYGTFGDWGAILAGGETVVYNASGYPTTVGAESVPNWKIMD